MKKYVAVLLMICMTASGGLALGEEKAASRLRVFNAGVEAYVYRQLHPQAGLEEIPFEYEEDAPRQVQDYLLAHPDAWDVAYIDTRRSDLPLLCGAGLLADLGREERFSGSYAELYPAVRQAVSWQDGLYAMPISLQSSAMQTGIVNEERLVALGLLPEDAPGTYGELRQLAEKYMALPKEQRKGTVFHVDGHGGYQNYLLYCFIEQYAAEYSNEKGAIRYDTEIFRHGIEDVVAMAKVLSTDMKIQRSPDAGFFGLTGQVLGWIEREGSYYANLRLRIGDQAVVPATMGMLVVNKNTEHWREALDFVDFAMAYTQSEFGMYLLNAAYEDLFLRYCDAQILSYEAYSPGDGKEPDSGIETWKAARASGNTSSFYPREAIAEYAKKIAPCLTFPMMPQMDTYGIGSQFTRGRLDIEALIQKLQSIADGQAAR